MAIPIIPPRRGEMLTPGGRGTVRLHEYLERLTATTNETTNSSEVLIDLNPGASAQGAQAKEIKDIYLANSVNKSAAVISALIRRINDLELQLSDRNLSFLSNVQKAFKTKDIGASDSAYTTYTNEVITCNNTVALDLTLNPSPKDGEELHIKRNATGAVNLIGTIDGSTSENIASVGDGVHLIYTIAQGEWGAH